MIEVILLTRDQYYKPHFAVIQLPHFYDAQNEFASTNLNDQD